MSFAKEHFLSERMRWLLVYLLSSLCWPAVSGCRAKSQPVSSEILMAKIEKIPFQPDNAAWQAAPEYVGRLLPQDIVEPRQIKPTTTEIRIRALEDGEKMALRLEWKDPTRDDLPGPGRFPDACALQVPVEAGPTLPAPQMGEPGRTVEILYWNAAWQVMTEGRGDSLQSLYPNAWVDHYPYEALPLKKDPDLQKKMEALYLPALALGNIRGGPRTAPVEEYVAEGPGTLTLARGSGATGTGRRTHDGWSVVLTRRLPRSRHVALAVWDGAQREVGSRKMRTEWISLRQIQRWAK